MFKKFISIIASVFLILVSACNMPGGPTVISGTNQDPTAAIQTQVAEIVASTAAAQTALANAAASTLAAMATNTTEFTFTSSLTPTPTFTLTPTVPMVSVSVQTNCRTGPGQAYDVVGVLQVGKTAEVVGRTSDGGYWIIRNPANPATNCWLWGQYATVTGNTGALPIVTPPPTPTPAFTPTPTASFNMVYSSTKDCGGGLYGIKFQITNNGSVTWESNRVIATDQVTSETKTIDRNNFPNHNDIGCVFISADQNLEAGEVGFTTTTEFGANPAGHSITATIRVCSLDGMAGICLEKTITFTP
ncbi:MAG: hypothetical protein WC832_06540 [Anaerolineales bacterium]